MAFQLPPLPNFQTNIPQPADPLQTYGRLLQLKQLQGQQQLIPLQVQQEQQKIQAQTLENQQRELELRSQQAMIKAWSDSNFLKNFTGTDKAQASGLGFDPDALSSSLISQGVLPKDAMAMTQQFVERSQKIAATQKDIAQTGEAQAAQRQKGLQTLGERVANILDAPAGKAGDLLAQLKQDLVKKSDAFAGVPQEDLAHVYGADLEHLPAMATLLGLDKQIADFHKSKAEATTAAQKIIPEGGGLSPEMKAEAQKEVTVAKAEQPLKLQLATAEAKAKQLIEGMAEPGYAFNPKTGETILTSKTDYLQSGGALQAFRKVGEKDVRDDTMLNNRLADVHQKIAEYEQALQKPLKPFDQSRIASVIGSDKLKIGAFGTEIPTDKANAFLKQVNLEGLSPEARDQVVAYYNAREAMMGYKTVLSGSARGSDKSMDLLTQALPDPSITDRDYSKRSLDAFKQNLRLVGQGLPTLPGIKSPKQVEADVWGKQAAGGEASTATPGPGNAQYHYQGKKGEIFSNDGQTWYDAKGNQIK